MRTLFPPKNRSHRPPRQRSGMFGLRSLRHLSATARVRAPLSSSRHIGTRVARGLATRAAQARPSCGHRSFPALAKVALGAVLVGSALAQSQAADDALDLVEVEGKPYSFCAEDAASDLFRIPPTASGLWTSFVFFNGQMRQLREHANKKEAEVDLKEFTSRVRKEKLGRSEVAIVPPGFTSAETDELAARKDARRTLDRLYKEPPEVMTVLAACTTLHHPHADLFCVWCVFRCHGRSSSTTSQVRSVLFWCVGPPGRGTRRGGMFTHPGLSLRFTDVVQATREPDCSMHWRVCRALLDLTAAYFDERGTQLQLLEAAKAAGERAVHASPRDWFAHKVRGSLALSLALALALALASPRLLCPRVLPCPWPFSGLRWPRTSYSSRGRGC